MPHAGVNHNAKVGFLRRLKDEFPFFIILYGGTYTMFDCILPQFGIQATFADPRDPQKFETAITEKTRAIFIETIGNPVLEFTDIRAIAEIAHAHNLPLIVDATFTSPYLLKTIEHGADIVVNSLTKWMEGHGTGIGGVVIDSGKFDWTDPKFKLYNAPDASYHDLRYAHDLGDLNPVAFIMRMRLVPLRNLGACISPDNAWMFLQGLETLPLRMQRHCENSIKVARFLTTHPKVKWVRYPGLEDDPTYPVARLPTQPATPSFSCPWSISPGSRRPVSSSTSDASPSSSGQKSTHAGIGNKRVK